MLIKSIRFIINFYIIYFSLSTTQRKVTKEKSPIGKGFDKGFFKKIISFMFKSINDIYLIFLKY